MRDSQTEGVCSLLSGILAVAAVFRTGSRGSPSSRCPGSGSAGSAGAAMLTADDVKNVAPPAAEERAKGRPGRITHRYRQ